MTGDPIMKYLYTEQNINKCELNARYSLIVFTAPLPVSKQTWQVKV